MVGNDNRITKLLTVVSLFFMLFSLFSPLYEEMVGVTITTVHNGDDIMTVSYLIECILILPYYVLTFIAGDNSGAYLPFAVFCYLYALYLNIKRKNMLRQLLLILVSFCLTILFYDCHYAFPINDLDITMIGRKKIGYFYLFFSMLIEFLTILYSGVNYYKNTR